jgi:hypothetical protein
MIIFQEGDYVRPVIDAKGLLRQRVYRVTGASIRWNWIGGETVIYELDNGRKVADANAILRLVKEADERGGVRTAS